MQKGVRNHGAMQFEPKRRDTTKLFATKDLPSGVGFSLVFVLLLVGSSRSCTVGFKHHLLKASLRFASILVKESATIRYVGIHRIWLGRSACWTDLICTMERRSVREGFSEIRQSYRLLLSVH